MHQLLRMLTCDLNIHLCVGTNKISKVTLSLMDVSSDIELS